jgi:IS30 family transposase
MSDSLMTLANLLGSICLRTNMKSFKSSSNSRLLLNDCLTKKFLLFKPTRGGEFQKLHLFFNQIGISHHISCPYAHQQNGSTESSHRHIVEVGLSLLAHASMPLKYWDEVFLATTYFINKLPTIVLDFSSPFEQFFHEKTNYSGLCTFGCVLA